MRSSPRFLLGLAVLILLIGSCVGSDSPTEVDELMPPVSLGIAPALIPSAADASALPINLIRAVTARTDNNLLLRDQRFPVDPSDSTWTIDISVPMSGATIDVVVFLTLINVAADGSEEVQFSGRSPVIALEPGAPPVTGVDVDLFRGPIANLNVTGVTITSSPDTLIEGKTATLSGTAVTTTPVNVPQIFWTSLDPTVLTTSDSVATGVGAGTTQIVASAGAHADTVSVVVIAPPVDSVVVTPASADVAVATTASPFTATLLDADSNVLSGRVVTWSIGDSLVATIDPLTGAISAVALGTTTVMATSEGVSGSATVNVIPPPVDSVLVSPDTVAILVGQTASYSAQTFDMGGQPLAGRVITWSVGDAAVATVDAAGVVTGVRPGVTTVTATSEGVSDDAIVVVNGATVVSRWNADGDFADAVGANDGVPSGGVGFGVGALAQAFDFDGIDDQITIGNPADLDLVSGSFSVSAWVRPEALGNDLTILGKMIGTGQDGWRLLRQNNDRFWFCFGAGTGNGCISGGPNTVMTPVTVANRWYHVAAVKDATTFSIYLDGVLGEQKAIPFIADSNIPLLIGTDVAGAAFFDGRIDEVEMFTGALSATQVDSIFNSVSPPPPVDSVDVSPDTATVVAGNMTTYTALALDSLGTGILGTPILWETADSSVATVDQAGTVTGVAFGTTQVLATSEGVTGSAVVHVDHTGPVIAGWDAARGGLLSLDAGSEMTSARTHIVANFPAAAIAGINQLNATTLQFVDALVISSVFDLSNPTTGLTAAEQAALLGYVAGGGCAVLLTDNGSDFFTASQSMLSPFGMASSGIILGSATATVTSPAATSVTNGPFGLISTFDQDFPAGINTLGPNGNELATNPIGTALAVIYDDALGTGSGPLLAFSDATFFNALFAANQNLWGNTIDVCLNAGLPAPSAPMNLNRWTNASGGVWSDAASWSKGAVPVATDSVVIDTPGSYTVTIDAPAVADYVAVGATQVLDISAGSLTVNNWVEVATGGELEISGGTLDGTGTVSILGALTWNGGAMAGTGITRIQFGATASISGSTTLDTRTFQNFGTVTYSGGILDMTGDNGAVFDNRAGGVIDIASATDPFVVGSGAPPSLLNAGTFRKTVGSGTTVVGWPITSTGAIDQVSAGSVAFDGGGSLGGTMSAVAGGALLLRGGTFALEDGLATTGPGMIELTSAVATIQVGDSVSFAALEISNAAANLGGGGFVAITDTMAWRSGTMSGLGTTQVDPGATLWINGVVTLDVRQIDNFGTVRYTGGTPTNLTGVNGPSFINRPGALVDFASVGTPFGVGAGAAPFLLNEGTLQKSVGVGNTIVEWPFTSTGALDQLSGGRTTFTGGGTIAGTMSAATNGELLFDNSLFNLSGGVVSTGGGFIEVGSANLTVAAGDTVNIARLRLATTGGLLSGAGVVIVNDTIDWTAGNMSGTGVTALAPGAGGRITGGVLTTRTFENSGTIVRTVSGPTFTGEGGAVLNNLPSGVLDLRTVTNAFIAGVGGATLNNNGRFTKTAGTGTGSIVSWAFVNNDTIDLATTGGVTWTGDFTHSAGAVLKGIGQALLTGANVLAFDGEVAPGTSPGILDIDVPGGGLTLGPASQVSVELEGLAVGTQHDQLNFDGPVALDGTLAVIDTTAFTPTAGDRFAVMTYVGRGATTFAGVNFPVVGGLQFDTTWAEAGTVDTLFIDVSAAASPSANNWTGAGDGVSWTDGANWSAGVPTATDSVFITTGGVYTVTLGQAAQVAALFVGTTTGSQVLDLTGPLTVTGGGGIANNGVVSIGLGGTLDVTNTLFVDGALDLAGGELALLSNALVSVTGQVTLSANSSLSGGGTLDNDAGTFTWDSGNLVFDGATLRNGGTTQVNAGGLMSRGPGGGLFQNDGAFIRSGTGQTSAQIDFDNDGTVDIQTGNLILQGQGSVVHSGPFTGAPGTAIFFSAGTQQVDSTVTGFERVEVGSLSISFNGTVTTDWLSVGQVGDATINAPLVGLDSLTVRRGANLLQGGSLTIPYVRLNGAQTGLRGNVDLTISDSLIWEGGRIAGTGARILPPTALTRIRTGSGSSFVSGSTITNQGAVIMTSALAFESNGVWDNEAGSSFDIQNNGNLSGTGIFNNNANAVFSKSAGTGASTVSVGFDNDGLIDVQVGTLDFDADFSHFPTGVLQGSGTVDVTGATVQAWAGAIRPGTSPGILTHAGAMNSGSAASYEFEINGPAVGTGYDQLVINGDAALDGNLVVLDTTAFVPTAGDRYAILAFNDRTGNFANVTLPTVAGLTIDTVWTANGVFVPDTLYIEVFSQFNPAVDFDASLLPAGPGGTNPNGNWTYGWSAGLQSAVTTFPDLFEAAAINCNNADIWGDGNFSTVVVAKTFAPCDNGNVLHGTGQLILHGGDPDRYAHVVFTAPSAMTCSVDADFISRQNLVDADIHVLINGSSDFSDVVVGGPGTTASYTSNALVLNQSDQVSFVAGLGTPPQVLHPGNVELDATLTCR